MSPIQQMLLGVGAVATKTYVDDVFSTYVYEGDGNSSRNITNNIDLLTEGGLVWYKSRSAGKGHRLVDTERGVTKVIESNDSNAEAVEATGLKAFLTNGFTVGSDDTINESGGDQASWTFRKAKGFFTCLTYVGNGSNRTISHDLGCVPGMIILKNLDASDHWVVYHRGNADSNNAAHYSLRLNTTAAKADWFNYFQDTLPTATEFTLGTDSDSNGNGENFIAYLFAGGESTTDKAVDFDGTDDYLSIADHSDLEIGSSDFTMEAWVYMDANAGSGAGSHTIMSKWDNDGRKEFIFRVTDSGGQKLQWLSSADGSSNSIITGNSTFNLNQWNHVAATRTGSTIRIFLNGIEQSSTLTQGSTHTNTHEFMIGANGSSGIEQFWDGKISNVRVIKGRSLYTGDFGPNREELKNDPSTKLLCCNGSTTTSSTVTPGTITAVSSPSVSTNNSIFDDPAGFVFGDAGDQNVIKCGSYVGNGSSTGPEINLGWEPQWLLIKQSDGTGDWTIFDSMRGIVTGGTENYLHPNSSDQETTGLERVDLTSTGFKLTDSGWINYDTKKYIFCAIRRPDGYVGKPPELGTGVFNMVMGTSNSDIPAFVSGFVTDFAFNRQPASSENWWTQSRITGDKYLVANNTDAESTSSPNEWDFMNGWYSSTSDFSNQQSWMWKRHAGFDVVCWDGNSNSNRVLNHSMNASPEMIWYKRRDATDYWGVGVNFTNSDFRFLQLNSDSSGSTISYTARFKSKPTSTSFEIGQDSNINGTGGEYIAMLFASVEGISKVGYYDGSNSSQTITTGFQPRFVIIKCTTDSNDWYVLDTLRGWGAGVDENLRLNDTVAQNSDDDFGAPTSTGFTLTGNMGQVNVSGEKFIYYAHA